MTDQNPFRYAGNANLPLPWRHGGSANRVALGDSPQLDAFHRLRSSSPFNLFESKHLYGATDRNNWANSINGVGASITHVPASASAKLAIGTADGEYAIHQTVKHFHYSPGRSQLIIMTGVLAKGKANLIQRLGYFDGNNGLFFELNGTELRVAVRSNTSGSVVDTQVAQSAWNLDRLDGSKGRDNPSKATIDITKAQIFIIDFQWLGYGRVRFSIDIDGTIVDVHEFTFQNEIVVPYMRTPNLPVRYEIRNEGITASSSYLLATCSHVASEGGSASVLNSHAVSNGITTRSISARTPILAIRPKLTFNSITNRITTGLTGFTLYVGDNCYYEIVHIHPAATFTGGTWADADAQSSTEFNTGLTSITGGSQHRIRAGYATAASGTSKTDNIKEVVSRLERYREVFVNTDGDGAGAIAVFMTPFTGTAVVAAAIEFEESY